LGILPLCPFLSCNSGAFSNVYKARDSKTGGLVAVKIVRKYDINAHQVLPLNSKMSFNPFCLFSIGHCHHDGNSMCLPSSPPLSIAKHEIEQASSPGYEKEAPCDRGKPSTVRQPEWKSKISHAQSSSTIILRSLFFLFLFFSTLQKKQRANILKEVQIMRQLKHPGIVELHEFSESEDHYYLVLELAPGGELFHRIVKLTYFSEELTRHVIVQVAQAIRYLHEEKGVVHRDIKPENILFEPIPLIPSPPGYKPSEDDEKEDEGIFQPGVGGGGIGRVKIADFGLSKVVWDSQTMTPCGTVGYTAPEIVKDERYSKSVDMWAMGCVLYTLLCGFPPFYDESIQALTEKVARGQYTFLSPWWDEISMDGN
jgi:serine/threonine protein kinase